LRVKLVSRTREPTMPARTRIARKQDFPVSEVRRYLEPGPIVLVCWSPRRGAARPTS